jgi:hypothetical protein
VAAYHLPRRQRKSRRPHILAARPCTSLIATNLPRLVTDPGPSGEDDGMVSSNLAMSDRRVAR